MSFTVIYDPIDGSIRKTEFSEEDDSKTMIKVAPMDKCTVFCQKNHVTNSF